MRMELILLRHSMTEGNKENRFIGVTDEPLAPEGEDLARRTAPTLPEVEHVYRSPLLRCGQTAALLWPGVGETVIEELRETDFGPFEGKNHEELKDDPLYRKWLAAWGTGEFTVGESEKSVRARTGAGLARLVEDARAGGFSRVGVVSHGGTLRNLMWEYGVPARGKYYDWVFPNCGGYRVSAKDGPLSLEVLGTVGGGGR